MPVQRFSHDVGAGEPRLRLLLRLAVVVFPLIVNPAMALAVVADRPVVGERAPLLSVDRLLNAPDQASTDRADLEGKVVVLEFWATWCAPCIANIPHLNELVERFDGKDVVFISLTDEPIETVAPFLDRKPIRGWVGLDSEGETNRSYGITGIPHTFIIGRNGMLLGDTHPARLESEHIDRALKGEPIGLDPSEGETVPATPRTLTYGGPYQAGDFPGVGFERNELPEPIAQVVIRPALEPQGGSSSSGGKNRRTWINIDAGDLVAQAFEMAYQEEGLRIDLRAPIEARQVDAAIWAPPEGPERFRQLVEAGIGGAFGVSARVEDREVDVLILEATGEASEALSPTVSTGGSITSTIRTGDGSRQLNVINGSLGSLASNVEDRLDVPVIDETELTGKYDFEIIIPEKFDLESAREVFATLGLKLTEGRRRLDYLVIEPAPVGTGNDPDE